MNEHVGVYGIVGLIAVFAAAGVFLTLNAPDSNVVVVENTRLIPSVSPSLSSPGLLSRPFIIVGRGITGAAVANNSDVGTGNVTFNATTDLNMNKSTITCIAELDVGATSAVLNTCNDNGGGGTATSGGAIACDGNTSKSVLANISTCDGGFYLANEGRHATLKATVSGSGPYDAIKTYLYNTSTSCNATTSCATAAAPVTLTGAQAVLCKNLTSSSTACQCMKIEITAYSNVVSAKAGTPISFQKNDTLVTPVEASC